MSIKEKDAEERGENSVLPRFRSTVQRSLREPSTQKVTKKKSGVMGPRGSRSAADRGQPGHDARARRHRAPPARRGEARQSHRSQGAQGGVFWGCALM